MDKKNKMILSLLTDDFNLILNALKESSKNKEIDILIKAREYYEKEKNLKKAILYSNKELQIAKTKQKIAQGIKKLTSNQEKINAINISKVSGLSLPTVYKYKDFFKIWA